MLAKTMETGNDPFTYPDGWSLSRSLFKTVCWAFDGLLAFSIPMIAFEAALNHLGVPATTRYAATALLTGIVHQIVYPACERLQTLATKRAIPVYRGNWWLNFF